MFELQCGSCVIEVRRKLECVRLARVLLRWREFLTRAIAILSSIRWCEFLTRTIAILSGNSIVDYRIYQ